ncbi:MAG: Ig-like domain-containing protein [Actinobacteria bacterium]|nr:Ig-like domain-containing protein [Actinomycetota bacterium]
MRKLKVLLFLFTVLLALSLGISSAFALNPVHQATQNGLTYMENHAVPWGSNGCYGCHVVGAAIKALSVGVEKGYTLNASSLPSLINNIKTHTTPSGEVDWGTAGTAWASFGMSYYQKYAAGKLNGIGGNYADESAFLSKIAGWLAAQQQPNGSIANSWNEPPTQQGDLQSTAYAAMGWAQAGGFGPNLALADGFLASNAGTGIPKLVQDEASRILGLRATGRPVTNSVIQASVAKLKAWQHPDGGWGEKDGLGSNAFATGQALVGLKMGGETFFTGDGSPMDRGINWLLANQITNPADPNFGAWPTGPTQSTRSGGALFGYTMWPVNALEENIPPIPSTIILTPKTATNPLWSTHTLEALVKDQNGNPMKDVTVTFTVTGSNPQTGTAVTNSSGIATWSYTGESLGTDTIVASADPAISNSVTKEWILVNTPGRIVAWGGYNNTSFFNFNILSNGKYPVGTFYYSDRKINLNLWSNQITGLMISSDKKKAVFTGKVKIGGVDGYRFEVYVNDNGNPGTNDKFRIKIYDPSNALVYTSNGTLFTGNIQIYP